MYPVQTAVRTSRSKLYQQEMNVKQPGHWNTWGNSPQYMRSLLQVTTEQPMNVLTKSQNPSLATTLTPTGTMWGPRFPTYVHIYVCIPQFEQGTYMHTYVYIHTITQ